MIEVSLPLFMMVTSGLGIIALFLGIRLGRKYPKQ